MAPKSSRRQQFTDEYTEESDSSTMKRRRKDRTREETETDSEQMEPSMGTVFVRFLMSRRSRCDGGHGGAQEAA